MGPDYAAPMSTARQVSPDWDDATLEEFRELGQRRSFKRAQRIVYEGDRQSSVVLIESGSVKIVASSADGDEIVLGLRRAGQLLGDLSAFGDRPTAAAAIALGEVTATVILASRFVEFLESRPHLLLLQLRRVTRLLAESDAKLLEMTSADVATRVARRLIDLVDLGTTHGPDGHVLETALSQEELAALCGASREAVARVLRDLREEGVLSTDRRRVTVLDLDALRARV